MTARAARLAVLASAGLAATGAVVVATSLRDPGSGAGRPRIAFDRVEHDFGVARQRQALPASFGVRNGGDAPLHLKVRGDCGCATPRLTADVVPPGGETQVDVVLHTETLVGRHVKHLFVASDDPAAAETRLALKVDVSAGIIAQPANFTFPRALLGTSPTAEVRLQWKEGVGRPFRVLGVEAKPQSPGALPLGVAFDADPFDDPPWHGTVVTMRFGRPPPLGTVSGTAEIRTDDPETPVVPALVGGSVSGRVTVSPREASFGAVGEGKEAAVPVHVGPFDATVRLGAVTARAREGRVEVEAKPNRDLAGAWLVKVRLPASAPRGAVRDVVEVRTEVPGEEAVEIPDSGTVVPRKAR
jgi:hypothetical protein